MLLKRGKPYERSPIQLESRNSVTDPELCTRCRGGNRATQLSETFSHVVGQRRYVSVDCCPLAELGLFRWHWHECNNACLSGLTFSSVSAVPGCATVQTQRGHARAWRIKQDASLRSDQSS